jgi:hypothetical protein
MALTYTLAYYDASTITAVKSFIVQPAEEARETTTTIATIIRFSIISQISSQCPINLNATETLLHCGDFCKNII